ncbi:F-box family protein [Striga asiatica]|uniref:F-box family protein n=1 Tax=Striga asiatica TaxID=4170 RepID=A0A5A7P378_STRAF|nr:F-box family protein [Striga asiatica]
MAIGKNCRSRANGEYGMGLVRSSSFGRKRVALSNVVGSDFQSDDSAATTTSKRRCSDQDSVFSEEKSVLQNLPQEILIKVLCGVEHDDLKRLFFVSKAIREATMIAKQHHFAYSTPKKLFGFQDDGYFGNFDEAEAPNAPKQSRVPRHRLNAKKLSEISVKLFASGEDNDVCFLPRRNLSLKMEIGS